MKIPDIPAGFKPVKKLFTAPRLSRHRSAGLLPAPHVFDGVRCYSDEELARCEDLKRLGEDEWMRQPSPPARRPRLDEQARLAFAALARRGVC